jgi:polysaccharide deacetylase 2 family uncharacterized protein YibQ
MPSGAGFFGGWSGLLRFWGFLLMGLLGAAGILQALGPPNPPAAPAPKPVARPEVTPAPVVVHQAPPPAVDRADKPGREAPGPIADPDPALLEFVAGSTTDRLPLVATDGRKAMRLYAAGFDPTTTRPRIGVLIAGIGLSYADSKKAIADLPGGVSLAVSPYSDNAEPLLAAARLEGHEYLLSLPMEPRHFPLNDAGPNAMLTTLSPQQNQPRLMWALSRLRGYAGVTDILGAMRGERLADLPDQMAPILAELNRRGLMYVAGPGQRAPVPQTWSKAVDLVIDDPATAADIDARLATLETMARDRGAALGLIEAPRPVAIERLAAWANGLSNRGLALAPVSALMLPPEDKPK